MRKAVERALTVTHLGTRLPTFPSAWSAPGSDSVLGLGRWGTLCSLPCLSVVPAPSIPQRQRFYRFGRSHSRRVKKKKTCACAYHTASNARSALNVSAPSCRRAPSRSLTTTAYNTRKRLPVPAIPATEAGKITGNVITSFPVPSLFARGTSSSNITQPARRAASPYQFAAIVTSADPPVRPNLVVQTHQSPWTWTLRTGSPFPFSTSHTHPPPPFPLPPSHFQSSFLANQKVVVSLTHSSRSLPSFSSSESPFKPVELCHNSSHPVLLFTHKSISCLLQRVARTRTHAFACPFACSTLHSSVL